MGFLSKIKNRVKKQIRPNNMMIGNIRKMPRRPGMIGDMRFRGRMPSFNPTIFGQPIGDMDFSQMPKISPEDIMNLQIPTQMPMTQDLPEVSPVGMMPQMRMGGMQDMEPRMMMQEGEYVSLERDLFSLQSQLKNLEEQLRLDRSYNDDQAVINTSAEMAAIQKRIQEIMEGRPQLAGGGNFPDLTGDGKVTQADILKGRGVYAEGDEVILSIDQKINNELKARGYPIDVIADLTAREKLNDVMRKNQNLLSPEEIAAYASSNRQDFSQSYIPKPVMGLTRKYAEGDEVMMMEESEMMAPGGDEIEASLMEVQDIQPEMQALDQYVQMVIEMVQAGASEAEVIESLRQAGLDDDDIAAVFQAVMETLQGSMEQGGIDAELAQLS